MDIEHKATFKISSQEATRREDADVKDRDEGIAAAISKERSFTDALRSQSIPDEIVNVAEYKRLFFGFEIRAPWPASLPAGRILEENDRHMTLAFLGKANYLHLLNALKTFPPPPFKVGPAGQFDKCLFLPHKHPHVVAWHVDWLGDQSAILAYHQIFTQWLKESGYSLSEKGEFLPHVTLCRSPFNSKKWEKTFLQLPLIITHLHLYESLGNSRYSSCWNHPLVSPFEELEHTADIAFRIHGETLRQIQKNALISLAFKFPDMLHYSRELPEPENIDDIVIHLNTIVGKADQAIGCPFKAVSFHGDIVECPNYLSWEMIVDV